jgi:hypothetical protein
MKSGGGSRTAPTPYKMRQCRFPPLLDSLCGGADNPKVVARFSTASRLRFSIGDLLPVIGPEHVEKVSATADRTILFLKDARL